MEGGGDFETVYLIHGTEDGAGTADIGTVILHALCNRAERSASRQGTEKQQHIFFAQGKLCHVVPEDDLARRGELRRDYVNGAVCIIGKDAGLGQFLGQIRADDLCAVEADDGVYRCVGAVVHGQQRCEAVSFVAAGLQCRDLHVIGDV